MWRLFVAVWALTACSSTGTSRAPEPAPTPAPTATATSQPAVEKKRVESLRDVDWRNESYDLEGPGKVKLTDGWNELHEYLEGEGTYHTTDIWRLQAMGYGDVDGDGQEDAVLAFSYESYGRNYQSQTLFVQVFAWRDGKAVMIHRHAAPYGIVKEVRVGEEIVLLREPETPPEMQKLRIVDGKLKLLDAPPGW